MENIRLIHGDCLEAMKSYPDNHFDVAIVDPPYGINRDGANKSTSSHGGRKAYVFKGWDDRIPDKSYFDQLFRVSKNQIIWGANYMTMYLPPSMGWIFWDKGQRINNSDGELAFSSFNRALRVAELNRVHIQECGGAIHPTQKPIKLYKWLLENYTNENDLILDTHLGSGSIAIACHYMKRRLIGYEIDEEYYNAACKRFKEQTAQQTLF